MFHAEVSERHDAVVSDIEDPDEAPPWIHPVGHVPEPVSRPWRSFATRPMVKTEWTLLTCMITLPEERLPARKASSSMLTIRATGFAACRRCARRRRRAAFRTAKPRSARSAALFVRQPFHHGKTGQCHPTGEQVVNWLDDDERGTGNIASATKSQKGQNCCPQIRETKISKSIRQLSDRPAVLTSFQLPTSRT
ncbi:hypothetical protein ABID58_007411 [Bradyrhizobium sp. S3.2.6]